MQTTKSFAGPIAILMAVTVLAVATANAAGDVSITGAELTEYGIYEGKPTGKVVNAPQTAAGLVIADAALLQLLEKTDVIEAHLNTRFGITFIVTGTPNGADVDILVQRLHPKMQNPNTGEVSVVSKYKWRARIGQPSQISFQFDEPWEIVPGRSTYQIFVGSKLVLEKSFDVQLPQ